MKPSIVVIFAVTCIFSTAALAEPISLSDRQLDGVTAGDLTTPSGQKLFEGFSNQGAGGDHPSFFRNGTANDASSNSPSLGGGGNEGPWTAHVVSGGVVTCADC